MALEWLWSDKFGEFVFQNKNGETRVESLYSGNALLISCYHFERDGHKMYLINHFFNDGEHAKRCLGLVKGFDNIFDNGQEKLVKIRINKAKCRAPQKLLGWFIKAFDELEIELYKEEQL